MASYSPMISTFEFSINSWDFGMGLGRGFGLEVPSVNKVRGTALTDT